MANLSIKVQRGTRSFQSPRLCDTCEHGIVTRGPADGDEQVFCNLMERKVSMQVTECNKYADSSQPPLWAMKDIAWTLDIDRKRQRIGFTAPIKYGEDE
jgi:hypothetical protein